MPVPLFSFVMSLTTIRVWGEMIRFSHSVFALPFALMAVFLAGRTNDSGLPFLGQVGLILVCMVSARSFAMTFNRIADRRLDARNPRTVERALPAGRISQRAAWVFLTAAAVVFILGCSGFEWGYGNVWPLLLGVPTLGLLAFYSFVKRFSSLAHFALGAAIGFSPLAVWIAMSPETLGVEAILLSLAVLFWIAGFDIIYACQDVDVDRREGLFSIPARLGISRALGASRACHVLTLACLVSLGVIAGLGWVYWVGAGVVAILLVAEQAVVKPNDLSRVNLAFFTLNGCVSLLLALATILDVLFVAGT